MTSESSILHYNQLFECTQPRRNRKGRTAARHEYRIAVLHCQLNVVGVVVAAADGDEVFAASRDEQFARA
jgi:hypothetical protein